MENVIMNGEFDKSKGKASSIGGTVMSIVGFLFLVGAIASFVVFGNASNYVFACVCIFISLFLIVGGFSSLGEGVKIANQKLALLETHLTCTSHDGLTEKIQYNKIISVQKFDGIQSIKIHYGTGTPVYFSAMRNYKEVYEFITDKINNSSAEEKPTSTDATEQLKKLKELLDMGIITQEEFESKKKQLLGL